MPKIMLEKFQENRQSRKTVDALSSIFLAITFKHFSDSKIFHYSGYMKLLHSAKLLQLQFVGTLIETCLHEAKAVKE